MSVKALRSRRKSRLLLSSRQAHRPRKMLQRQFYRRSKPCHSSQTRTCRRPCRSGVTQWYLCKRNTSRSPRSKECAQSGARRHALAVCRLLPAKTPPSKSVASESIRSSVKRECEEGVGRCSASGWAARPPRGRCGTRRSASPSPSPPAPAPRARPSWPRPPHARPAPRSSLPSRRFTCTVFQLPAAALPVRLLERVPLWKRRCRGQLPVRLLERVPSPDDCLTSALAAWTAPSVSSKAKPGMRTTAGRCARRLRLILLAMYSSQMLHEDFLFRLR